MVSMLRLNLFLAIGYFLGGYVGLLLSITSSHVSAIWPAAGLALASVYTYGARVIPGIWIGAIGIQTYFFLDPFSQYNFSPPFLFGAILSIAAIIQSSIGAWLINRYVGPCSALIDDRCILGFLLLGGPVGCAISASFSVILLYLSHSISLDTIVLYWMGYWPGDVVGVLVFAPVLLCFIGEPRNKWRLRIPTVALPLMILFMLLAALSQFNSDTLIYHKALLLESQESSWSFKWLIRTGFLFTVLTSSFLLMLTGRILRSHDLVKVRTRELKKESSERQNIIRQHRDHNQILHAIASPAPLSDILNLIVSTTEKQFPATLCSILLLNEQGEHLQLGVAPSLPQFYVQALDGLTIGEGICDFGTTATTGQRTIVENIEQNAYWQNFSGLAKQAGLAASWSEPILSSMNHILGVFTVYHKIPQYPGESLIAEVCDLAQLASIAIERRSSEKQIIHLAYYDALTNLPNRRLFLDHLEKTLASALRHHTHAALLYLDLDHFKTLNDSLGHDIGDELLIQVASRLRQCIRDEDTVARLGGDEFVLLLSSRDTSKESMLEHALSTAERVQSTLEVPYQLKEHIHHITPSIGITLMPQPDTTPGELLKQADTAMYHAKNRGRNSISFYSVDMQRRADQRLTMEKDLRVALSERQFSLHYQPQFDNDYRLIGAEALIRWQHPEKGMISPVEFIPVAEETSLILFISEWVLQEACLQLQKWPDLPHLAINISPKQFRQPGFERQIAACLTKYGVASSRLILEITEGSIIEDIDDSIVKLQSMQSLGIDISIDDFGTGYSSLAYLKLLPLNQLKIDQSFVRDIIVDNNDAVIVETIISMSKHLGLSVIAEGVETAEQLRFLRDRKCKGYQGYFFSKPLPAYDFARKFINGFDIVGV